MVEFLECYHKDLIWSWIRVRNKRNLLPKDICDWLAKHFPIPEGWGTKSMSGTFIRLMEREDSNTEIDTST